MKWVTIAGGFVLGIVVGAGTVYVYKKDNNTLQYQIKCSCRETSGGLRWNVDCPKFVKDYFKDKTTCP